MIDEPRDYQDTLTRVFGRPGPILDAALRHVLSSLGTFRYSFMPQDQFESIRRVAEASQVYWSEVLYRAHFSALVALLRCRRWLATIHASLASPNLLGFAAAYRALLEAGADTQDTFLLAEPTIAQYHRQIAAALAGRADAFFMVERLEDSLIHFMYGRRLRRGEAAPASHRAKPTSEYLDNLRRMSGPKALELYAELCNLTHPAGPGVMAYTRAQGDGKLIEYWPGADESRINEVCAHYIDVAPDMLMAAVVPPLMMLKVLNSFGHAALLTPAVDRIDLSEVPAWRKAQERLSK